MTIRFLPTEEQVMFRDTARRWVEQEYKASDDPSDHWAQFAALGWLMIGAPETAGGLGGDAYDVAILAEELGRGLVRAPFVEVAGAATQVLLALAPDRVEAIASGEARPLLAHDESEARGDQNWVKTRATRVGDDWRLNGRKTGLVGAPMADGFLVTAQTDAAVALFLVDPAPGILTPFATIDDRPAGELRLEQTPATLLAEDALPAVRRALDYALVIESAEALGAMQAALDLTRDYLLTRVQYGQRLADFQALRHRLADMFIEVEQARSIVLRGLAALVADGSDRAALAAATRARVAAAARFVGAQAVQLHGGIGVTEEYPVGHMFKRLCAFELRHGTAAVQLERFAALTRADDRPPPLHPPIS